MKFLSISALSKAGSLIGIGVLSASPAAASFLDTDFWCRTYGCAVVYDSDGFEIYDNWQFSTNSCCVPFGGQMQAFYANTQTLRLTGTTNEVSAPTASQGLILGVSQNGSTLSQSIIDDGDGFLDASDQLAAFALNSNTDLLLDGPGKQYSHSFWVTSRNTRFSLRALAQISESAGDFRNTVGLGDIKLTTNVTDSGNDGGFDFGSQARNSNVTIINNIGDLGDLAAGPTRLIHFGNSNGIRLNDGDLNEQSVRLDFLYQMPDYDLSLGIGELNVDVVFDFYREANSTP